MITTTVIYHKADFDGLFCREIAKKFLTNCFLIGWDYGDPEPPVPTDHKLYILDLSVDGLMTHPNLIWIDHHKTAIEKYPKTIPGYRIDGVAACRLAWFYFTALERYSAQTVTADFTWFQGHYPWASKQDFVDRKLEEPLAVQLAGEYDIWDKRNPDAELFQHALRAFDLEEAGAWPAMLLMGDGANGYVQNMLDKGKAIQYSKTKENESIIKAFGFTVQFEGFTLLACNAARYNSQLFKAGLKPEHDGMIGFNWDGKGWRVSLYTDKPGIDLSPVAIKYGGGGHAGACGFRCATLPFIK